MDELILDVIAVYPEIFMRKPKKGEKRARNDLKSSFSKLLVFSLCHDRV
jgi:hypothetical protein